VQVAGTGWLTRRDRSAPRDSNLVRAVFALVVAVSSALLIARCGSSPKPAQSDAQVRAGIAATLSARSTAVQHHDRAAYLATDADTPWRSTDASRFDAMAAVPFASWQLTDVGATAVAHLDRVQLAYQVTGVDPEPVKATEYLSFRYAGGSWLVADDHEGAAQGLRADVQLWDLGGPVTVVRGSRSLVMGLGGAQRLQPYADLADHGATKASKIWGGAGWHGTVLVEVPSTEGQAEALLNSSSGDLQGVAAVTAGELGKTTASAPASRVLVNPDEFALLPAESWQVVIDHELTHGATRSWTTSATPLWLSEGAADYTGFLGSGFTTARSVRDLQQAVASGFTPDALPTSADFQGSGTAVARAYNEGYLACRYIAEKYGQAKLVAFYKAVGTGSAGAADPVEQAFRTVLGTTTADFTVKWRQYVLVTAKG
jgi:hypothetical protein